MIAIIFDVDDTLYNQIIPFQNACESILRRTPENIEKMYQEFSYWGNFYYPDYESAAISLDEYRIVRFVKAMERCGVSVTRKQAEEFQMQYLQNQSRICLSKKMCEILDQCREKGSWLGIMTNGPTSHQMGKIDALGLKKWIPEEHIFISESIGYTKPHHRIFAAAQGKIGQTMQQIYMVGDSYEKDMKGAMQAGWCTIWMNHRRHILPDGVQRPDEIAYSELELQKILEKKLELMYE